MKKENNKQRLQRIENHYNELCILIQEPSSFYIDQETKHNTTQESMFKGIIYATDKNLKNEYFKFIDSENEDMLYCHKLANDEFEIVFINEVI